MPKLLPTILIATACAAPLGAAAARQPADLVGTWELAFNKTGSSCRVMLRTEKSDKGDYFLGMPSACRHAMPGIAAVGRWSMPDEGHVVLGAPGGARLLTLAASGDDFVDAGPDGTFTLRRLANSVPTTPLDLSSTEPTPEPANAEPALLQTIASHRSKPEKEPAATESREDLPGRYAVMREKHDTGCMITLDRSRSFGADRAQLAPGCRDQGIVIFDPSSWQLVKGRLVLTAKAGHKATLEKQAQGQWEKDPKEGGKPLGLKKL